MIYLLENEEEQWMQNCTRESNKDGSYTVIQLELTNNIHKAFQFSRRTDAEDYLKGDSFLVKCGMLVTEHEIVEDVISLTEKPLNRPIACSLVEVFKELKFGRTKEDQIFLQKCIDDLQPEKALKK